MGFIETEELRKLQAASDLIISKPGGLSTFEILTAGRPIIVTGGIGLQEQFNAGFLKEQGAGLYLSPNEIGDAALTLLDDEEKVATMLGNQEKIKKNFKLEQIVEWVRHAKVLQPEPPVETVYQKIKWNEAMEAETIPLHLLNTSEM